MKKFKRMVSFLLSLFLCIQMLPAKAAEPIPYDQLPTVWPTVNTDLTHIICYGQSFSTGSDAPYYADETVDGVYVYGHITNSTNGTELKPLTTATADNQHPIISAGNVLAQLLAEDGYDTDLVLGSYGTGGRTIAQLMSDERQAEIKEEEGYNYDINSAERYEVFQSSVAALAEFAKENEQSISCPVIVYLQGETDQNTDEELGYPDNPIRAGYGAGGDKEKYKEYMSRLKEDMQREVMEVYGQTEKPLFLIYQVSGTYTRTQYSSINMAQLEFAQENDDVILVQTPYFTSHYTSSHHLTQNGYRWLGEYIGRYMYTALVEGEKSWPLLPERIEIVDEYSVKITVSGAENGLTIDTWTVEDATNDNNLYGFYLQADGANITPTHVSASGNTITLTLPIRLTAETVHVYYAGKNAKGTGNIRDNCAELGFYDYLDDSNDTGTGNNQGVSHSALDENGNSIIGQKYPLYNWLASFCYEVEVPETARQSGACYRWEMGQSGLVSVTEGNAAENELTLLSGSIEDGVLSGVQYSMDETVLLIHNRPWVIEWKAAGNGSSFGGGKLLTASASNSYAQYLYLPADSRGLVAWGVGSDSANYGFKLTEHGIDTREEHIYRIENRIDDSGENTVYLLVNGVEIGAMTTGYRTSSNASGAAGSVIEGTKNWSNGKDIYLDGIGDSGSFLLNNLKLSYLQIEECCHTYDNGLCTDCGAEIPQPDWEVGTIAYATGQNRGDTNRLRTSEYLNLTDYSAVTIGKGYMLVRFVYDEEFNYLNGTSWLGDGIGFSVEALREEYPKAAYFRVALCATDGRELALDDLDDSGVMFYLPGEEVPEQDYGFVYEDVGSIGSWQDGAIWDGKLFVLGTSGTGAVYEVETAEKLGSLTLDKKDVIAPHANSVCFGSTYYAAGDEYPLLYVNIYNNYASAEDRMEGTCCVYRITETDGVFSTELVQIIEIGFTEDMTLWKSKENNGDVRPYGNFVVDTDASQLYAFVMRDASKTTRFFSFDIPGLEEGTYNETYGCNVVTLEQADIAAQFDTEYFNYLQGCCYSSGKIVSVEGFGGTSPLRIVDLETQTVEGTFYLGYAGLTKEPEVVCVDPVTGLLYYAAADGVLRAITLDNIHFHAYETVITDPTCTEQGYTTYTCECGDGYVENYTYPLGHYASTADVLADGEKLVLVENNTVMTRKHMRLVCNVDELGDGKILLGHGTTKYSSQYIEITADALRVCTYYKALSTTEYSHGLAIEGTIVVSVDVNKAGRGTITITNGADFYVVNCAWYAGRNGEIFCTAEGTELTDVDCRWYCEGYDFDVWFYGDSYFSVSSSARWTTHMNQDGYADILLEGYGGMGAATALNSFKNALKHGVPEYAVWCVGMNNGDKTSPTPNATWLSATDEFLQLCEEYAITPILSTIPSTPKVNNKPKNEWVRTSGYRYIDFDYAVVADYATNEWYSGFLSSDNVHPATDGAVQLYLQTLLNFPELFAKETETCDHILRCVSAKNSRCEMNGCEAFWLCSLCGSSFSADDKETVVSREEIQIPSNGHTEVVDAAVIPTCTETGMTEGRHCSVCEDVLVAQTVVDALGHSEVIDAAVASTCTATGLTEGKHCSVCNEVFITQEVADALGHDFQTYISDNNATCTAAGTKTAQCVRCDVTDTIKAPDSALGHLFTHYSYDVESGFNLAVCDRGCGQGDVVQIHSDATWLKATTGLQGEEYGIGSMLIVFYDADNRLLTARYCERTFWCDVNGTNIYRFSAPEYSAEELAQAKTILRFNIDENYAPVRQVIEIT